MSEFSRRDVFGLIGAGAALPSAALAQPAASVAFRHGVASGDPTSRGAILWTRVTPADAGHASSIRVRWTVSDRDGGRALESGEIEARPARDFTAKVEPQRLKPGRDYWYWFEVAGTRSPAGRFRTLPQGRIDDVALAVVSCQLHSGGLFNAYDALAKLDRVDAVVHLGDYIYEYSGDGYGAETAKKLNRIPQPNREIVTLADYRERHAQYKADPDLQAAHARAAFIAVWDDHEVANDSWVGGAENHQPESEGDWAARKRNALQAYFEWMPIREPIRGRPWESINRSFQFGDIATLLMVETRLLARSEQAEIKGGTPDAAALGAVLAERKRPDREMLGEPQRQWVEETLTRSVKGGTPWQLLGNQVVMARVAGPVLETLIGPEKAKAAIASVPEAVRARVQASQAAFRAGLPFNMDAWDGYPAARQRLYASFARAGTRPIVLAGDSHAFWANDLHDDAGKLVAAEFGTSSISSPSVGDALPQMQLGAMLEAANEEVVFCDQQAKGFILLTLTREAAKADYVAVSTIFAKPYEARSLARFEVKAAARGKLTRLP